MKLEDKKRLTQDLAQRFSAAKLVIITDYKGLDVASLNALRGLLKEQQIEYKVVKNTLSLRAAEGTDVALLKDFFVGPNAVALSYEDPVSPAKILVGFAKENDKLDIKAGVLNGKVLSFEDIKALAELPSKEILLGQLLSVMTAVPTSFVRVLSGVQVNFLNVLQAIKDKKEAA